MLGIIFTGGQSPSSRIIKQELENKEAIYIAADSGLIAAEEAGIKPHFVIGDMDSVDAARLDSYPAQSVIRHATDKDYTDTELAFSLAVEKECDEIWIIGGGNDVNAARLDHLFAIRSLFEREIFPTRWITDTADIYCIDAYEPCNILRLTREKGAIVSVFPLASPPWEARSTGLKWPLAGLPWDYGFFGLSNVAQEGDFSITAIAGRFMVVIPRIF